jgi:hypothetical protein
MDWSLEPTLMGAAIAAAAVAGGAPLFAGGLRAWRLRRELLRLRERPLRDLPTGLVHLRGRIVLETPLFAPLSGEPCAGFVLDAGAVGEGRLATIAERRPFRVVSEGVVARVAGEHATLRLRPAMARQVACDEKLSERVAHLLARSPEVAWVRSSGRTLNLVERVLPLGAECHVVGVAHAGRPEVAAAGAVEQEVLRTGTDDMPATRVAIAVDLLGQAHAMVEPDLWVDDGGSLEFLLVSDHAPGNLDRLAPRWKTALLALGPLLTLAGLLYLAHAADRLAGSWPM